MRKWWSNLPVATKLYTVVGIMASLICIELFTLHFAMTTLSAVRAFVGGEGLWSKAQKSAIYNLQKYGVTHDEQYYAHFQEFMKVPLGDHKARVELEKAVIDMEAIEKGFVEGQNHPHDVEKMVKLMRRFYWVPYLARAIASWHEGDKFIDELMVIASKIKSAVDARPKRLNEISELLAQVSVLDTQFTRIEIEFSSTLGEASRWLETILMTMLILAVIAIEGTGLFLTMTFARNLSKILREMNVTAQRVGRGDFTSKVTVRSGDELGQLAQALNSMIANLDAQIKGRLSAEQASEAKNLFLGNMSHEIRTPLNAILGFSELLHSADTSTKEKDEYLAIVKRTGASLSTIINDILDVAKMEAEEIQIQLSQFSLQEMLSDLSQILRLRSDAKGIELQFHKKGEVADYIKSDYARLRQILTNIIGNAIKFTSSGAVTVEYEVQGQFLLFTVRDTGIGIQREQMENLFQPFSQGDSSVRKVFGGTGLGLHISKKLAQLLGGDVGLIESAPGLGSQFYIRIQYSPVLESETRAELKFVPNAQANLAGKRILICEDSLDNQTLIRAYLRKAGAHVEFANNGQEGLLLFQKHKFDLVLMDMQMPVMDGFTATMKLREIDSKIPIIALTGYAMKQDERKCYEAGCDGFLVKPFNRSDLDQCIAKFMKP